MLNLPFSTKYIVHNLTTRGGKLERINNTNIYTLSIKNKIFYLADFYTPLISCVYQALFSSDEFRTSLLRFHNLVVLKNTVSDKSYSVFITKNRYYNILLREFPLLIGNGTSTIKDLVFQENLRRIASNDSLLLPVRINNDLLSRHNLKLLSIPRKNEKILFYFLRTLEEGVKFIDVTSSKHEFTSTLAKKIINLFPGIGYIRFDCDDKGNIEAIDLSASPNVFFAGTMGNKKKKMVDVVADLILQDK